MLGIIIGGLVVAGIIGLIYWLSNQPNEVVTYHDDVIVEETTIIEERWEERH